MNDVKRKILIEGLVNIPSLIAVCGGLTLFLIGVGGAGVAVASVGFLSIFGGIGWSLTNLTLNFDSIKQKILADKARVLKEERDRRLDDLDSRLIRDRDPRDQGYLREIRSLYDGLESDITDGKIDRIHAATLLPRIEELFEACVDELEYSYRLWEALRSASGSTKERLREEREQSINNVGNTVDNFSEAVTSLMTLGQKRGKPLEDVRSKLDSDLAVAKRVEERLREMDNPTAPNYEEYLH